MIIDDKLELAELLKYTSIQKGLKEDDITITMASWYEGYGHYLISYCIKGDHSGLTFIRSNERLRPDPVKNFKSIW